MRPNADHLDPVERDALLAALAWQAELGVDECIGEIGLDRFALPEPVVQARSPQPDDSAPAQQLHTPQSESSTPASAEALAVTTARRIAKSTHSLADLRAAMLAFEGCALKKGARTTVFADGAPAARVMIIGEISDADEDRTGKPFAGRPGQLLDRMLASIGMSRTAEDPAQAVYLTNAIPWRPVGNRNLSPAEWEMMWAFLERHIQLVKPEFIVTMGRIPASTLMADTVRLTRIHGQWQKPNRTQGIPLLPTLHPAFLLRQPAEKAKAWGDLLTLRAALDGAAISLES